MYLLACDLLLKVLLLPLVGVRRAIHCSSLASGLAFKLIVPYSIRSVYPLLAY